MERNGLRGGVFTNLNPGILGLEMPLHQSHHHFQPQQQQPAYPVVTQNQKHSDEDEEGGMDDNAGADGKRKGSSSSSPWQRMKWTDGMVRLLIMAVYYIGDECGSESNNNGISSSSDAAGKKKAAGALMQKKGKWKSVSKAMMEKGFYVSPQQCEDKFNDLNKRYKRVNEILGKGTACRVVENQSLLDQMDHLSVKSKDEVRKLLNSKHLFFREMCAYHNSCGAAAAVPGHHSPEQSLAPPPPQPQNLSGNRQIHHHIRIKNMDEKQCEDDDSEHEDDDSEDSEVRCSTKRPREENMRNVEGRTTSFEMLRVLNEEVAAVMEDETKSGWEKRRWMKMRMVRVEEEKVEKEMEAFEMEKERLKWIEDCGNKERDMERKRLRNERGKLECDRMLLLLKHKEMEFDISPSSVTG